MFCDSQQRCFLEANDLEINEFGHTEVFENTLFNHQGEQIWPELLEYDDRYDLVIHFCKNNEEYWVLDGDFEKWPDKEEGEIRTFKTYEQALDWLLKRIEEINA